VKLAPLHTVAIARLHGPMGDNPGAVCGIRIITSDDPDNRDAAKKCILYVLVGLLIIGLAGPVVNIFTGSKYMQARSVRLYDFNAGDDYLQISVRTLGESCTSEITWKIKASGESDFVDYSAKCLETSSQFTLAYGRSKEGIRCSSNAMPPLKKGPHVARITWCGTSREFTYPCGTYKTFTECEKRDGCWWDDHAETCNFCNAPATKIQTCTDYPTDIVKLVGEKGRCPLCTRNPCRVAEGPCYISDALFGTECKNCDGISECTDYGDSVASCECDAFACKVGTKTDHACDWSEPTDTFITVEIPEGAGAAEGGTMKLKCGDTDVSAVVMDVSGSDVRFKIAKEDMEKILDAGCWYE
ncbi:MAG: pilin, partial [Candidatus Altiarchaeota archaeon]|nr:pilin [Candidatus Altiarchaeota archaeon]